MKQVTGTTHRNDLLEPPAFIQVPGPNPLVTTGPRSEWDGTYIECAGIFEEMGKYYLYYHGAGPKTGYQLGVAVADNPLGPFRKHDANPILRLGQTGEWDDLHVAHALIIKRGINEYFMWYCGKSAASRIDENAKINTWEAGISHWEVGLATADNPLGPWTKHPNNPVVPGFGYVSAVVEAKGKFYLYSAYPIGSVGPDYSPIALATADQPEGPWTRYEHNPILSKGEWGEWDDGGYSDASVIYSGGLFHMFMAGCKQHATRILGRESLGYAWSEDGIHFTPYGRNPVATRDAEPNNAAIAEPRVLFQLPYIYVYHTLRYCEPLTDEHKKHFPLVEDIGVQVLVTQKPFSVDMPLLSIDELSPGACTTFDDTPPLCLSHATRVSLTSRCAFADSAAGGLKLHIRASADGRHYDTADLHQFDHDVDSSGNPSQRTFDLPPQARFIKVLVENSDAAHAVRDVQLTGVIAG